MGVDPGEPGHGELIAGGGPIGVRTPGLNHRIYAARLLIKQEDAGIVVGPPGREVSRPVRADLETGLSAGAARFDGEAIARLAAMTEHDGKHRRVRIQY